ncbi:hypothetical protein ACLB2K_022963 [Fragaria x ananassa]
MVVWLTWSSDYIPCTKYIALVVALAPVLSSNMTILNKNSTFFFIFVTLLLNFVPFCTSAAPVSFSDHCTSLLTPDYSTTEGYAGVNSSVHSLTGFYHTSDGSNILSQNSTYGAVQDSVEFHFWYDGAADERGLFRVQGSLEFPRHATYFIVGNSNGGQESTDFRSKSVLCGQGWPSFKLNGIWSEASGELCMVGSGSCYSKHGNVLELPALLKLYKLKNSSSLTSLISGTLESLVSYNNEPNYFGPLSMSMLPSMNYQYTFAYVPQSSCSDGNVAPPLSLKIEGFCSTISDLVLMRKFELKYPSHCVSAKNCSPLSVSDNSDLPSYMSLWNIECLEDEKKLRVLVDFVSGSIWRQRLFNPSTTLVGEGSWDAEKNQLCVVACRFSDAKNSLNIANVDDCSTRVSFWIPAAWTITSTSSIQGQVWSNKAATEPDYFQKIIFESSQNGVIDYPLQGQEYEYTKTGKVAKLCQRKKIANDNSNNTYPHPFSYVMRFRISAKKYTGEEIAWGISTPLSVGNQFYSQVSDSIRTEEYPLGSEGPPVSHSNIHNISYKISIKAREGSLCMIGCRDVHTEQSTSDSVDCEIIVNIEFPPTNPRSSYLRFINGSIESTRKKSDPLYFERVEFTSAALYNYEAERTIWWMDVEIIMVLLSNIFACVFGILQLFYVKRHPDVLPCVSICMLYILGLGSTIPLVLNFDAMITPYSSQTLFLGSNGWHEFNEIIVNTIIMVSFLVQIRLLKLTWSARSTNGNQKELWGVEKLALFVALPVFVAGSLLALLLMNWRMMYYIVDMIIVSGHEVRDILGTVLKTCAGLVLDAFLLPQIVLNIFRKSKENSLAASFYIGTTFVRVLPHAYYVYRDHHNFVQNQLDLSYIYAGPAQYMYSTAWNVIIPCGGLLFAGIIYLQQRFGGRCILPHKLREFGAYEKVNV